RIARWSGRVEFIGTQVDDGISITIAVEDSWPARHVCIRQVAQLDGSSIDDRGARRDLEVHERSATEPGISRDTSATIWWCAARGAERVRTGTVDIVEHHHGEGRFMAGAAIE